MSIYRPIENPPKVSLPFIDILVPAGFPTPAADYIETRIDLNDVLVKNPAFTFFHRAQGDSMEPMIREGNLLVIDNFIHQPNGCLVLALVDNEFCVKYLYKFSDGSVELRSHNPKYKPILLPSGFELGFEIRGRVMYAVQGFEKWKLSL